MFQYGQSMMNDWVHQRIGGIESLSLGLSVTREKPKQNGGIQMAIEWTSPLTWFLLVLAILSVWGIYRSWFGKLAKSDKVFGVPKSPATIFLIVILGFSLWGAGIFGLFTTTGTLGIGDVSQPGQQPSSVDTTPAPTGSTPVCAATKVSKKVKVVDTDAPGTELTGEYVDVWIAEPDGNGGYKEFEKDGRYLSSSTFNVAPFSKLIFAPAINSTATNYYSKINEEQQTCVQGEQSGYTGKADKVVGTANLTTTVLNTNNAQNSLAIDQIVGVGSSRTVDVEIVGKDNQHYSSGSICMACNMPKSTIDDLIITGGGWSSLSNSCAIQDHGVSATDFVKAFERSTPFSGSAEVMKFDATVDSDDVTAIAANTAINCTWYDKDVFVNLDTGLPEVGYETERKANVGATNDFSFIIYVNSTA